MCMILIITYEEAISLLGNNPAEMCHSFFIIAQNLEVLT